MGKINVIWIFYDEVGRIYPPMSEDVRKILLDYRLLREPLVINEDCAEHAEKVNGN